MTESFPLKWPYGKKRTQKFYRETSSFKTTRGKAIQDLLRELNLLGARNIVVSTNVETYRRGGKDIPYANQKAIDDDPGVAVYYTWHSKEYVFCCDKWKDLTENIQSLVKTINAIRGIQRWGTGEMMASAFDGFQALPEPEPVKVSPPKWYEILGISQLASVDQIKDAYRKKAMVHHPDVGGNSADFIKIQTAYKEGLSFIK